MEALVACNFSKSASAPASPGANLHQDRFAMGSAVPDSVRIKDLRLLKKMGINFIRLAHYPHDPVMLAECDRLGIIVWEEFPWVNTVGREKFAETAKNMLREMIRRDRNHPSVVFWGLANETAEPYLVETRLPY
jgi:beta-galactosidase